jgi:hypothetical protein
MGRDGGACVGGSRRHVGLSRPNIALERQRMSSGFRRELHGEPVEPSVER